KLMAGAYGTLGVVTEVSVRLHPRPRERRTVVLRDDDPRALATTASDLAHRPLEAEALDVRWEDGAGAVLVALSGRSAPERPAARACCSTLRRSCAAPSIRGGRCLPSRSCAG